MVEKEKTYNIKYTRAELEERIRSLQSSKNLELALQVMEGQRELEELNKLVEIMEKDVEKKEE